MLSRTTVKILGSLACLFVVSLLSVMLVLFPTGCASAPENLPTLSRPICALGIAQKQYPPEVYDAAEAHAGHIGQTKWSQHAVGHEIQLDKNHARAWTTIEVTR